jgi:hypothetical protein
MNESDRVEAGRDVPLSQRELVALDRLVRMHERWPRLRFDMRAGI